MQTRWVMIWFGYLKTDWAVRKHPELAGRSFVLAISSHGRMVVTAANETATREGISPGMVVADARAMVPSLVVLEENPAIFPVLLKKMADWSIRFTPFVALSEPDGLLLNATGCAHLWGGEKAYLEAIAQKFLSIGYSCKVSMADTIGCAWALSHYGQQYSISETDQAYSSLLPLPPAALRIENTTVESLHKLGLHRIRDFIGMPGSALRRRWGQLIIERIRQATGQKEEVVEPVFPVEMDQERLPCLEPVQTPVAISIALEKLLEALCSRLRKEEKGIRKAVFKAYRIDGNLQQISIGTNRATHQSRHLFRLFETKIEKMEPEPGIELFVLEAPNVEKTITRQESLWEIPFGWQHPRLGELLDRLTVREEKIRVLQCQPAAHHWPERSYQYHLSLEEKSGNDWHLPTTRPLFLLPDPHPIEVTAPIPDYPPMLFRYKGKLHKVIKADGPERIEQEWWIRAGEHRDYYQLEDEEGKRYWIFRLGHYTGGKNFQWFIHGFFA